VLEGSSFIFQFGYWHGATGGLPSGLLLSPGRICLTMLIALKRLAIVVTIFITFMLAQQLVLLWIEMSPD
jgi:hypothetical protein